MAANIFLKTLSLNLRKEVMIVDGSSRNLVSKKESEGTASKRSFLRRVVNVTSEYHIVVFLCVNTKTAIAQIHGSWKNVLDNLSSERCFWIIFRFYDKCYFQKAVFVNLSTIFIWVATNSRIFILQGFHPDCHNLWKIRKPYLWLLLQSSST